MPALLTILTILGWLAVIVGAVLLVWDAITHRVLSRPGIAAVIVGIVLLVLAYALAPAGVPDYDALGALLLL